MPDSKTVEPKDIKEEIVLRSTIPFKLKDKNDRRYKAFDLYEQFGFIPDKILITKLHGKNNTIVLSAVVPKDLKGKDPKKLNKDKSASEN